MNSILWLRRDLRRNDLPALARAHEAAQADGGTGAVYPLYVIDPAEWDAMGEAPRAWLAATLKATRDAYGGHLSVRVGDPAEVVAGFVRDVGASSVHVSRDTTPQGTLRDQLVSQSLAAAGIAWVETGTPYAVGPGIVRNMSGEPFQVFTPFARAWRAHGWPAPAAAPAEIRLASQGSAAGWEKVAAATTRIALPAAGEDAALDRWRWFVANAVMPYKDERDFAAIDGTSRLSPYLALGVIHPRTLLAEVSDSMGPGPTQFINEVAWREFYADVLFHNPESEWEDLRPGLAALDYNQAGPQVEAWKQGRTGFPFVDAGMRQLLAEGWVHNRVRMIVASFLTKDLHVWWPVGARYFTEHLIDIDPASNSHGWQWVAGTGTDAAPYFRVFNPVVQGLRFDPDGDYVRRWVPELAHLPGAAAHEPWKAHDGYAGGYPKQIVDHSVERDVALDRYKASRAK